MNVLELIKKRMQHTPDGHTPDYLLEEALASNEDEIYLLLTEQTPNHPRPQDAQRISLLFEAYTLTGLFDLECPLSTTGMRFILYVFSKNPANTIKIGMYQHMLIQRKAWVYDSDLQLPDYPGAYLQYCRQIECWINDGIMPSDTEDYEFNEIPRSELLPQVYNPKRYSKKLSWIKEALQKEDIILLHQVAEVLRPKMSMFGQKTSHYFAPSAWKYPLSYDQLQAGTITNVVLRRGDIVLVNQNQFYLLDQEPDRELYPSPNHLVIRPAKIQPEYLYLYLKSNTGKTIINTYTTGTVLPSMRRSDLANIPVILPKKDPAEYEQLFHLLNYQINDVAVFNRINQHFLTLPKKNEVAKATSDEATAATDIEDILQMELAQDLRMYKQDVLQRLLASDLHEINVCFRNGAYKATLILAGSILEAVLIDWLSEIKNENYFETDYMVTDRQNGRRKRADLIDYINEIKEIERPHWMAEAAKAHTIRQKRNLVHAKLCLNTDEINEDVCRQVIDYLRDVLKTRGVQ